MKIRKRLINKRRKKRGEKGESPLKPVAVTGERKVRRRAGTIFLAF